MSLLSFDFSALKAAATHAIGRTPDTGVSAAIIANRAYDFLQNQHNWQWLQRPLSVNFVADQSYIALPADFKSLAPGIPLAGPANAFRRVIPSSVEEIIRLRQMTGIAIADLYIALSWTPPVSDTTLPIARLEVYPTPAASESGALLGMYIRTLDALSGDTDVPKIPAYMQSLLWKLCRCGAHSTEEPSDPETAIEWGEAIADLRRAINDDGQAQSRIGEMRGAVSPNVSRGPGSGWLHNEFSSSTGVSI